MVCWITESELQGENSGNICSKLDVMQTTMTSIQTEKFTGDWLQKWKVKDMEIALDSRDTVLPKNKNRTKNYEKGRWSSLGRGWDKGT